MTFARHFLLNSLKKELRYEMSLDKNVLYLSEFIRKHGMIQQTSENSVKVNLYKETPPFKFQIELLHRRQTKVFDEEELEIFDKLPHKLLEEDMCPFYISIQKDTHMNLHLECITINSTIMIHHMRFTKEMPQNVYPLFHRVHGLTNFNILNEALQKDIVEWLKTIGITDDIGKFVEIMSLYKEKQQYKYWLRGILNTLNE